MKNIAFELLTAAISVGYLIGIVFMIISGDKIIVLTLSTLLLLAPGVVFLIFAFKGKSDSKSKHHKFLNFIGFTGSIFIGICFSIASLFSMLRVF